MRKYRNYYIDNVAFHSEADIDKHIKGLTLKAYRTAVKLFDWEPGLETSAHVQRIAEELHREFGMTWAELEEIETSVYMGA